MTRENEESRAVARQADRCPWAQHQWVADWPSKVSVSLSWVDEGRTSNAEAWVKLPDFPGWNFLVTFSPAGVPVGFRVEADKGLRWNHWLSGDPALEKAGHSQEAPPITARFLRRLPVREIQEAARHAVMRSAGMTSWQLSEHWARTFDESPRPGRRGRGDRFYAELAAAYVDRCESPRAVNELARELGYSESQIRNWLYAARRRGLLTSAPAGRSGGELTKKAFDLLEQKGG